MVPKFWGAAVIDKDGFRLNVGIIVVNSHKQLLWCQRLGMKEAWQFPQGGINDNETVLQAMYRELLEELGLLPEDVAILGETKEWITYHLPKQFRRYDSKPLCVGQKQKWFLLRLLSADSAIQLTHAEKPEFEQWQWVDYWHPPEHVIEFKRDVYRKVLQELEELLE